MNVNVKEKNNNIIIQQFNDPQTNLKPPKSYCAFIEHPKTSSKRQFENVEVFFCEKRNFLQINVTPGLPENV